jgi:hypothetical protein
MRKLSLIFLGVIAGAVSHKYERGCQLVSGLGELDEVSLKSPPKRSPPAAGPGQSHQKSTRSSRSPRSG